MELKTGSPLVLLIGGENEGDWLTREGLERVREFADGIGPAKKLLDASVVRRRTRRG